MPSSTSNFKRKLRLPRLFFAKPSEIIPRDYERPIPQLPWRGLTVDNARTWSGEVSAGVDGIELAPTRRGERIETGKTLEQLVIAPCKIDIVAAESEDDDFRTSVEHCLPIDLH